MGNLNVTDFLRSQTWTIGARTPQERVAFFLAVRDAARLLLAAAQADITTLDRPLDRGQVLGE